MQSIDTVKNDLTKNFNTLQRHLTDIVAATESGFGSQPIDTLSNWIVGHILIHRIALLNYYPDGSQSNLNWLSLYPRSYLSFKTTNNDNDRKSYSTLLTDLKHSQNSIITLLDSLKDEHLQANYQSSQQDLNNKSYSLSALLASHTDLLTIEQTSIRTMLVSLVEKESDLTLQFVQEQRQNSKTGIY